jgi:hypothetical protein
MRSLCTTSAAMLNATARANTTENTAVHIISSCLLPRSRIVAASIASRMSPIAAFTPARQRAGQGNRGAGDQPCGQSQRAPRCLREQSHSVRQSRPPISQLSVSCGSMYRRALITSTGITPADTPSYRSPPIAGCNCSAGRLVERAERIHDVVERHDAPARVFPQRR